MADNGQSEKLNPKLSEYRPWRNVVKRSFEQKKDQKTAASLLIKESRNSRTDPLTGLHNEKGGDEKLVSEIERAIRSSQTLGVLYLDMDSFKLINDMYGHDKGDSVIRAIANSINNHGKEKNSLTREIDTPIRLHGDEFFVILPDIRDGIELAGGRIRVGIERRLKELFPEISVPVTVSIGGATYFMPPEERPKEYHRDLLETIAKRLKEKADAAMYASKKGGKNKLTIYREGMIMPPENQNND